MTSNEMNTRARLRLEQNFLIMLLSDMSHFSEDLPLTEGAPTVRQMREFVYPEWEGVIMQSLRTWAKEHRVGVPNFDHLVELTESRINPSLT